MKKTCLVAFVLSLAGCDGAVASSEPTGEIDLAKLVPADAVLVGVAISPEGKRYVLDERSGLYELGDGSARLVLDTKALGIELTDVVALDSERFALTAENDGFLLNLPLNQVTSYFCYLPAGPPTGNDDPGSVSQAAQQSGLVVSQRTDSVAFSPESGQLFAQPRTKRLDTGESLGSEFFVFAEEGGQPIQVLLLPDPNFVAGGMVATPDLRVILGAGNRILEATEFGGLAVLDELKPSVNITGMARDQHDALWYLDGAARRLVRLKPASLERSPWL